MGNLFKTLEYEAFRAGITPRSEQSRAWFQRKAGQMFNYGSRESMMKDDLVKERARPIMGSMMMYMYDPKHKATLPYYDTFPLTIMVGPAKGGFYGINLHYLPNVLRAKMLDSMLDITNNKYYDATTRFNVTYSLLKSTENLRYFAPCWKHYLWGHVKSRFAQVEPPEWEIATFLPTQNFKKETTWKVYSDSRKIING